MKENKLVEAIGNLDEKYINEAEQYRRKARKRPVGFISVTAMAACFLLVCGINLAKPGKKVDSVVCIDVNPSIELTVSKKDKVLEAVALNEDAKVVLADMNLKDVDLSIALNAIMGSLYKNGYLDDVYNAVNVCVENDDTDRASRLGEWISSEISSILDQQDIIGEVNAQYCSNDKETKQKAADYEISVGKLILAQKVASNMNISLEAASQLSIEELWDLLDAECVALLTKEEVLEIAAKDAGVELSALSDVSQKVQETAGIFTYIVKFHVGGNKEYEYKINAVDGTIITCEFKYTLKEEKPTPTTSPTKAPSPTAAPEPTQAATPEPTVAPTEAPSSEERGDGPTQSETTVTPEPTPEPTQAATPEPTQAVSPEATPEPTKAVTPEATTEPTQAVTPEATPEPTKAVTPEATPEPTQAVTPEVTPTKAPEPTKAPKPTKEPLPQPEKPKKEYTKKEALALVYQEAGVEEKDAKLTKLEHKPKEKQYHIEFSVGLCDYVYDISSVDGSVMNKEVIDHTASGGTGAAVLTEDQALELALAKAGVTFGELTKCDVKYKAKKDGKEFTIHFHVNKDHYEYIVDAVTGEITEKASPGPATPEKPVPPHEKAKEDQKVTPVPSHEKAEAKLPGGKEETGKVTPVGPKG
ncbi:MAG: PepSY domain-containing protein [Lachnospiraceae bacterium]|nr:PepSY domain-containing protein [Lachnospiraceae bacterium]